MRSFPARALACLLLTTLATACGSGGQNRPSIVGMWPAAGDAVEGPLPYVRIDYNEPVRLLNSRDYRVTVDGGGFGTVLRTYPDAPNSIYFFPSGRFAYPAEGYIRIEIRQGLVVNGLDHYNLEVQRRAATSGPEATLPVGVSGGVSLVDCTDGSTVETVPAPGAHDPVAVLSTLRDTTRRIWVQFDGAGGVGTSLAWFEPGDAGMTAVALTSTGELTTPHGALGLGPRGRLLYAAFRDEGTGEIRVHAIDTETGTESDVLVLASQPAAATAVPRGLALQLGATPPTIHVVTEDAGAATVARIDRSTFVEQDLDTTTPGIQGITLPATGGPCVVTDTRTWVTRTDNTDLALAPGSGTASELPGVAAGAATAITLAPDDTLILQGLSGFAGTEMLQARTYGAGFTDPAPVEVSDDVGGVSTGATAVIDITWLQGSDTFLVALDTPGGAILTEWAYAGRASFEQLDLDDLTAGIQARPLVAAPLVLGANHGPFPR